MIIFYLIESLYYFEKLGLKIIEIPIKIRIRDYAFIQNEVFSCFAIIIFTFEIEF